MKRKNLQIGDRVWIEHRHYSFSDGEHIRTIHEAEVIRANTSSAYAVGIKDLSKKNPYEYRIDQKNRKIKESGVLFGHSEFWESREDFDKFIQKEKEIEKASKDIVQLVKKCRDIRKLKEVLNVLEN